MDSRAKQRLTGAVILVALFVLLVPELLTGPHKGTTSNDAQSDPSLRRYTIDLDDKAKPPAEPAASSAAQPAVSLPAVPTNPATSPQPRATAGEEARPELPPTTSEAVPAAAQSGAAPPAVTSQPKPVSAPVSAPRADTSRPAAVTPRGSFVVQLGSFGSRENADRLVRDMNAKGFHAFMAPITSGGRELYRVRVGPAPSREAAEALATQLKKIGESGSIVPIP